mmetsp:Transcript_32565/g.49803  ORF Transcript_32565/g.49803 Transcript_32565/m.49803 type:complete len:100 (-) Transcript_32565:277-576(-)
MLKFLIEYKKIKVHLTKVEQMSVIKFILLLVPRVAYFFYWIFDTWIVLVKIRFCAHGDKKLLDYLTYRWGMLWSVANFFSFLGAVFEIMTLAKEEGRIL